jgi:hypothetical protein
LLEQFGAWVSFTAALRPVAIANHQSHGVGGAGSNRRSTSSAKMRFAVFCRKHRESDRAHRAPAQVPRAQFTQRCAGLREGPTRSSPDVDVRRARASNRDREARLRTTLPTFLRALHNVVRQTCALRPRPALQVSSLDACVFQPGSIEEIDDASIAV